MTEHVIAAALTPPAAGGIAVVQIVGEGAPGIVAPLLKTRTPLDVQSLHPGALRLARFVDGEEEIDEVIVGARREDSGRWVIDLSLHGGQRVVQRVLLALAHAGARVVPGVDLLHTSWPSANPVQREALPLLMNARTAAVAQWLLESVGRLPAAVESLLTDLDAGRVDRVRESLRRWRGQFAPIRYLLQGVRAVLVGEPNAGKSTLANLLAGREASLVSEVPGTTRDWLEHPGAVDGVPFTFVDTAGIRTTEDPLESEAIRRSHGQASAADVVVHVVDGSLPPPPDLAETLAQTGPSEINSADRPRVWVWNKGDLPLHTEHRGFIARAGQAAVILSARTGENVDALRARLLETCSLTGWKKALSAPFADLHQRAIAEALAALDPRTPAPATAHAWLKSVTFDAPVERSHPSSGL